ncbi:uncharacterized protein LOC133299477 [Gastrolobium bilobum]|uniref:uncharacterized protein LOC133299477 n=1 Tax=Gastrolobium bilobum TaxID=150636 RepID=UPI002AB1F491|nr:uncharacterized protein LOC133299477 [Gastrolobium bilobum]
MEGEADLMELNFSEKGLMGMEDDQHREPRKLVSYKDRLLRLNRVDDPLNPYYYFDVLEKLEECKRLKMPLIVKLMGKKLGARFLWNKLHKLLNLEVEYRVLDLENDHYMVDFEKVQDYLFIQQQGPWIIADHYLIVQRWRPNFDPFDDRVRKLVVWIRIPGVPRKFYTYKDLWRMGNMVGRTLRIDESSLRFKVRDNMRRLRIEEGLPASVLKKDQCTLNPENLRKTQDEVGEDFMCSSNEAINEGENNKLDVERSEEEDGFGNWMNVQKGFRKRKSPVQAKVRDQRSGKEKAGDDIGGQGNLSKPSGSRFSLLKDLVEEDKNKGEQKQNNSEMLDSGNSIGIVVGKKNLDQEQNSEIFSERSHSNHEGGNNQASSSYGKNRGEAGPVKGGSRDSGPNLIFKEKPPDDIGDERRIGANSKDGMVLDDITNLSGALKPNILVLVLLETRVSGSRADRIVQNLDFDSYYRREAIGFSREIWILWNKSITTISILLDEHQFVHSRLCWAENGKVEYFTFVYGSPRRLDRSSLWDNLRDIGLTMDMEWAAMGYFNSLLEDSEKQGGSAIYWGSVQEFSNCLRDCKLSDLGFLGAKFTWKRGKIQERIDRLVPFRFLVAWLSNEGFGEVVDSCWDQNLNWVNAKDKFKKEASIWNYTTFKELHRRKHKIQNRMRGLEAELCRQPSEALERLHRSLWQELNTIYVQEELTWFQRSRCKWMAYGDRNTRFFHSATLARARRNKIKALKDDEGVWEEDPERLKNMEVDFYRNLYSVEAQPVSNLSIENYFPVITDQNWEKLGLIPDMVEVRNVFFSMKPYKAPGVDGLHAVFFQSQWEKVGQSAIQFVREVFQDPAKVELINQTLICLIPKIENPESLGQFRPISLCNVIYKVVTKVVASRLKKYIGELIMPNQCSFVQGRQASDNIIISQEIFHSMRAKKGIKGWMTIKVDLEKAYDRVSLDFLKETMRMAGFLGTLIDLIMACVSTSTMNVLWNGAQTEEFKPTRGIRQGDPLSPYLFVLCIERLGHMISSLMDQKKWKPVKLRRRGPPISHLFFADDLLLFMEASLDQAELVSTALNIFCLGSDLGKYLGIAILHKRVNKNTFKFILERTSNKLSAWKQNSLSMAGRVVLTKSVLASLPTYAMQTSLIPLGTCDAVEQ